MRLRVAAFALRFCWIGRDASCLFVVLGFDMGLGQFWVCWLHSCDIDLVAYVLPFGLYGKSSG